MRAADEDRLHLSVLTFAEVRHGIERLPQGKRRERLRRWMNDELAPRFGGRTLGIDRTVAETWGVLMARAAAAGVRLPSMDTLMAATAERYGMTMVTRNVQHFAPTGLNVVNPWS